MKKNVMELPNPEAPREPCVAQCDGCDKQYDDGKLPVTFCISYMSPKAKWKNHTSETITKNIKGKETEIVLHYNPCNLASHAKHTLTEEQKGKLNPLKASKRKGR